jgi:hypothetical protein
VRGKERREKIRTKERIKKERRNKNRIKIEKGRKKERRKELIRKETSKTERKKKERKKAREQSPLFSSDVGHIPNNPFYWIITGLVYFIPCDAGNITSRQPSLKFLQTRPPYSS